MPASDPGPPIGEPPSRTTSVSDDAARSSWLSTRFNHGDAISSVRRIFEEPHELDHVKTSSEPDLVMDLLQEVRTFTRFIHHLIFTISSVLHRPLTTQRTDWEPSALALFDSCKTYAGHPINFLDELRSGLFVADSFGIVAVKLSYGPGCWEQERSLRGMLDRLRARTGSLRLGNKFSRFAG